ncbi:Nitrogen regulation protein NR(I) [Gemmata obscuriglobus]|uniref:DNA-binding transcriptional regulator NtrC n=1 Tax=Gemmata obscuriglobus TaxID=114 RepID=A0A2Z3GTT1_9BACT|nr:sigma-54 dependent transcriptional regulator [Gemmata obscuriglobus]AWM35951.1 sigma-54-dependent Fis family transcriptional regulator [Gemmata obscuriglobus]QEG31486.1 Nitrogen regulation protein NR(I) [Gemmata obscuriglobus]VTS10828.1 two sigma54 transcriptional fis family : Response regulator with CheY-like receiver, AAA-type ATPase, and DNA-binding domains OS=Singulisphaera acidiphila (strain ATCC BAA-1392 / DSM 18658 / VKM B-2454 / MOB10) GN=Sinac_7096 PE=4 SV=1: Response_reg: Sigma54_ac
MSHSILIIDDEEPIAWALRRAFERDKHRVAVAATAEDGLVKARLHPPDVVFLDVKLPGMDGLTALGELKKTAPNAAVVVITAHGNLNTAVKAVEGGAFDYLAKPFELAQAVDATKRALSNRSEDTGARESLAEEDHSPDAIIGRSPSMQTVFKRIAKVAPSNACVLITGESGTGKELVARAIHANSPRRHKPLVPAHVAAFNPNLVESELFGHVKGAFTGAERARDGLLKLADGGTVFLDELADIPLPVQAKLLRVLERQEVQAVGGSDSQTVDVRIVSATHADLSSAVREGKFRHDLFFRLNVYPIHLPPLRDRVDDIPFLAEHFLRKFGVLNPAGAVPAETIAFLKSRPWPGNVRELRNALEHAAIESRGGPLRPEHFPEPSTAAGPVSLTERLRSLATEWVREQVQQLEGEEPADLHLKLIEAIEPAVLDETLRQVDGNRLVAARWLGLARATVRKLIRKYHPETVDPDGDE